MNFNSQFSWEKTFYKIFVKKSDLGVIILSDQSNGSKNNFKKFKLCHKSVELQKKNLKYFKF